MMLPLGFIVFPYLYFQINKLKNYNNIKIYFFSGFLFGFGFLTSFLVWIINPFLVYESTKLFAFLSILLIIFLSLFFAISFILFKYINNHFISIITIPLIFVLIEITIANFAYGFPWVTFSLIISNNLLGLYLIKYFGTHFLSFLILCCFIFPVTIFFRKKINFIYKGITIFFIFFIVFMNFFFKGHLEAKNETVRKISVELFQMNNPVNIVETPFSDRIYDSIANKIKNSDAEILIFAENNFPYLLTDINNLKINSLLRDNQKLIIGATRFDNYKYYNSILVLDKDNSTFFDKKILVPYGEFLPLRQYLYFLETISGTVDFSPGSKKRILKLTKNVNFIPVICYEIIFFQELINEKNNNAQILINITNDGWFGSNIGPYQHFYLSKMKAAEFNKPLLRISNNGISAIINNKGQVIKSTKLNTENQIRDELLLYDNSNLLQFHKYFNFVLVIFFITIICCVFYNKNEK